MYRSNVSKETKRDSKYFKRIDSNTVKSSVHVFKSSGTAVRKINPSSVGGYLTHQNRGDHRQSERELNTMRGNLATLTKREGTSDKIPEFVGRFDTTTLQYDSRNDFHSNTSASEHRRSLPSDHNSSIASERLVTRNDGGSNLQLLQAALAFLQQPPIKFTYDTAEGSTKKGDDIDTTQNIPYARKRKLSDHSHDDWSASDDVHDYNTSSNDDGAAEISLVASNVEVNGSQSDYLNGTDRSQKRESNDINKRVERNKREKERSSKLSKQIFDLRELLAIGGVILPKGTKGSVLEEAAKYIRSLQQQQAAADSKQRDMLSRFNLSPTSVKALARDIVIMPAGKCEPEACPSEDINQNRAATQELFPSVNVIDTNDYKLIFNSSAVGLAIVSMGGYFVDCNKVFCSVTGYSKEQICAMTIFNLIAEPELPKALDQITGLIMSSVTDSECDHSKSVLIRASPKIRENLGFSFGIVRYAKVVPKGFCITLVNYNNNSPVLNAQVK